jgi:hypothetical protein
MGRKMRKSISLFAALFFVFNFVIAADPPATAFFYKSTSTDLLVKHCVDKGFKSEKTDVPCGGIQWFCSLKSKEGDSIKIVLSQDSKGIFESALCLIDSPKSQWDKRFPQNFFKVFGKLILKDDAAKTLATFIDSGVTTDSKKAEKLIVDCKVEIVLSPEHGKAVMTIEPMK